MARISQLKSEELQQETAADGGSRNPAYKAEIDALRVALAADAE